MKRSRQSLGFVLCLLSAALWAVHASTPKAAEPAAEPAASATTEPVAEPAAVVPAPTGDALPPAAAPLADETTAGENAATEPDWEALVAEAALAELQAAEYEACVAEAARYAAEAATAETAADEQEEHVFVPADAAEAEEHVFVPAAPEAEEHVFVPADEDGLTLCGQLAVWTEREWSRAQVVAGAWSDRVLAAWAQAAAHQPQADVPAAALSDYDGFVAALDELRLPEVASAQGPMSVATPAWDVADRGFRGCEQSAGSDSPIAAEPAPAEADPRPSVEARAAVRPVLTAAARVLDQMGQSLVELSRQLDQAGASMADGPGDSDDADPTQPPTVGRNTIPESVYGL